jgi:hypothetical protein
VADWVWKVRFSDFRRETVLEGFATMTVLPTASQSNDLHQQSGGPWRRPVLVVVALSCVLTALLSARPILSPVKADDAQAGVSESPSDVKPPSAAQPAAEVPKATCCCPQCRIVTCRRGRLGLRLLRCWRPRCCWRCVAVPERGDLAQKAGAAEKPDPYAWKELFDGKTLKGWKVPQFGGEGKVYVKDGTIVMEMGETMTGITWTGELPRDNYELQYEGTRLDGVDFFATVVGISCIDYYDASDNATTRFRDFKNKQWYKFRVRVTPAKIEAWIDDEQMVNQERAGHKIDIRMECDLCRPLGFATYCTTGAVRNIRIRRLEPAAGEQEPPAPK